MLWILIPVLVNSATAFASRTSVLLDGRLGPSSKRGKIVKVGSTIVVSVPQRISRSTVPVTKDWVPLSH